MVCLPLVERFVDLCPFAGEVQAIFGDEDVELCEERAKEVASGAVGQALVQLAGLLKQIDGGVDAVDAALDAGAGACELLGYGALLQGDSFESFAELAAGELAIGGKIDQPILLRFELGELGAERVLLFLLVGLHLFEGVAYLVADLDEFLGVELLGGDSSGDGLFDVVEADAGHAAEAALFAGAEVVLVGAAVAGVLAVDEAAVAPGFLAFGSAEGLVDSCPLRVSVVGLERMASGEVFRRVQT